MIGTAIDGEHLKDLLAAVMVTKPVEHPEHLVLSRGGDPAEREEGVRIAQVDTIGMLLCRPLRQDVNSSGSRVENAAPVPVSGQAAEVQARAEQPVIRAAASAGGDPLHDVAGQIDGVDARLVVPELGQEERVSMGIVGQLRDRLEFIFWC